MSLIGAACPAVSFIFIEDVMRTERMVREDMKSLRELVLECGENIYLREEARKLRKELAHYTSARAKRVMVVHSRPTR